MTDPTALIADARESAADIEKDGLYDLSPKHVAEDFRVLAAALESSLAENDRLASGWFARNVAEVKAAAFEEGVEAGYRQCDDEWRQKRKVRVAANPYRRTATPEATE